MADQTKAKKNNVKNKTSGTGNSGRKSSSAEKRSSGKKSAEKSSSGRARKKAPASGKGVRVRALRRKHLRVWMALFWGLSLVLMLVSRLSDTWAEWYATKVYPIFVGSLGRVFSLFPASVVELGLYAGILWTLYQIFQGLRLVVTRKRRLKEVASAGIHRIGLIGGILLLMFTLLGGINYQRDSFVENIGLQVEASQREELVEFLQMAAAEINAAAETMGTDDEGRCQVSEDLRKQSVAAMEPLGEEFESLDGYYPNPKPILISDILSYQKVTGIYSPFTAEANYNPAVPDYELPHTLCHELAHLKGFMREEEANFIAWLACIRSDIPEFRYSGWLVAYIYAGNDLARYDRETYLAIRETLCETAKADLTYGSQFWKQFDGPVAETHSKVNDVYLKVNSQSDGVESYGRVVELMLAYLRE